MLLVPQKVVVINIIPTLQRIRHYMDWNTNCIQYLAMREVHSTFITEILKTAANFSKQDDGE